MITYKENAAVHNDGLEDVDNRVCNDFEPVKGVVLFINQLRCPLSLGVCLVSV